MKTSVRFCAALRIWLLKTGTDCGKDIFGIRIV